MNVSAFLDKHFRHYNAKEMLAAAAAYRSLIEDGGKMFVTIGGAMSTAELGVSLAEMIRQEKVHAISCTAANLEEDFFNLIGNQQYRDATGYLDLTPQDEQRLRDEGFNRVADTCIPDAIMRQIEKHVIGNMKRAAAAGESRLPQEFFFQMLEEKVLEPHFQIPPEDSWVVAAHQKQMPVFVPGFEDSTMGNIFCARVMEGVLPTHGVVKSGTQQMEKLVRWYRETSADAPVGFFQIGGGIAGDFPICAVPLMLQDLKWSVPFWSYFAQISDSVTSYGSYSGAVPSEKITWSKLGPDAPKFSINSDATIVVPLIFAYVLGL